MESKKGEVREKSPSKPAIPARCAMAEVLKADVLELVGMACNASTLTLREGHEGALDRIAALGAAAAEIAIGADLAGVPLAAAQVDVYRASAPMADLLLDPGTPDERDRLAAELGQNIMHIRYGGQDSLLPSAIRTFARWLAHRRLFAELAAGEQQERLTRFSARVLHEWLSDVCISLRRQRQARAHARRHAGSGRAARCSGTPPSARAAPAWARGAHRPATASARAGSASRTRSTTRSAGRSASTQHCTG
jgi:hypothetical protein